MASGVVNIRGRDYKTVALRVEEFRSTHPLASEWGIRTVLAECSPAQVIVRAEIVSPAGNVVAAGHAQETWGSSQINQTSALENCETSAIGRALAAAGFGGTEFASANEVERAMSHLKLGVTNQPGAPAPQLPPWQGPNQFAPAPAPPYVLPPAPIAPPAVTPIYPSADLARTPDALVNNFVMAKTTPAYIDRTAWEQVCLSFAAAYRRINQPDHPASLRLNEMFIEERARLDGVPLAAAAPAEPAKPKRGRKKAIPA